MSRPRPPDGSGPFVSVYRQPEVEHGIVWHPVTGPWVWLRLASFHYDGLTVDERLAGLDRLRSAIGSIGSGEAHLLVTNLPARIPEPHGPAAWVSYAEQVAEWEAAEGYTERATFLGVRLNRRRIGDITRLALSVASWLGIAGSTSRAEGERETFRDQADAVARIMAGSGYPVLPATVPELARLTARHMWLDLDLAATSVAGVASRRREFGTQLISETGERWVAALVPKHLDLGDFPGGEWLAPMSVERPAAAGQTARDDIAPELSVRFMVVPAVEQARQFDRVRAAVVDQVANIGRADRVGLSLVEQREETEQLAHEVRRARAPWVHPSIVVTVTGGTLAELKANVQVVTAAYEQRGVTLIRPASAQGPLLAEQAPGAAWRRHAWDRWMPLTTLAGGMPHAVVKLGDDTGPYLGHSHGTLGRWPVRFDPLGLASANASPVIAVTGKPGSGKSALTKSVVRASALRGARILYLDPAGETGPLLDLLDADGISSRVISLDESYAGALGPWEVFPDDPAAAARLAADYVRLIMPGLSREAENAVAAATKATNETDRPSMAEFVEQLTARPDGRSVGEALGSYADMSLGSLIFGRDGAAVDLGTAVTVIRYAGLDLAPSGLPLDAWLVSNFISAAVLHGSAALMDRLVRSTGPEVRKLVAIDEAHAFTRSASGRGQVLRSGLTYRKLNGTLWLSTQNAEHLGDDAVLSTLSTVFAHRCEGPEAAGVAELLLRPGHEEIVAALPGLGDGECYMRDRFGRVGRVQVDVPDAALWDAVQTTPPGETTEEPAPLL